MRGGRKSLPEERTFGGGSRGKGWRSRRRTCGKRSGGEMEGRSGLRRGNICDSLVGVILEWFEGICPNGG